MQRYDLGKKSAAQGPKQELTAQQLYFEEQDSQLDFPAWLTNQEKAHLGKSGGHSHRRRCFTGRSQF